MIDDLKALVEPLVSSIIGHAFNQAMINETLALAQYTYYCVQDQFYLDDYSRALAMIAARCQVREHTQLLLRFASEAIDHEQALHTRHLSQNLELAEPLLQQGANAVCRQYTNYLLAEAKDQSVAEALAAVLPCFYVYWRVGKAMHSSPQFHAKHRYRDWIEVYASPSFEQATQTMFTLLQENITEMHQVSKIHDNFLRSTNFEQQFWQACMETHRIG